MDSSSPSASVSGWWRWPVISAIGLIAVLIVNYLANALPLNDISTGDVTNQFLIPFQPAGWVFGTIWPFIYLLLGVYVVASFLPATRHHVRMSAVGPWLLVANIANIVWLFSWHWTRLLIGLLLLIVLVASLFMIHQAVRQPADDQPRTTAQRLISWVPFSVYIAWACVATLANVQILMDEWNVLSSGLSSTGWTVVFILIGLLIAIGVSMRWHDAAVPLVIAYAYIGIAARQWDNERAIVWTAIAAAAIAIMFAIAAVVRSSRTRDVITDNHYPG